MSRIGKLPINVPQNVDVQYDGVTITVSGKFGTITETIPEEIEIIINQDTINVKLKETSRRIKDRSGLYRSLINNMVIGVSEQFTRELSLKGVGYRATVEGNELILNVGYSHQIKTLIYKDVSVEVKQNTTLILRSHNLNRIGHFAAAIRSFRSPEPYKGKGILYKDEQIIRKAGKSGK